MAVYQAAFDPENWVPAALGFGQWPTRYILDADADHREKYIQAALEDFPEIRRESNRVQREYRSTLARREEMTAKAAETNGGESGEILEDITDEELDKMYPELAACAADVRRREKEYKELTAAAHLGAVGRFEGTLAHVLPAPRQPSTCRAHRSNRGFR